MPVPCSVRSLLRDFGIQPEMTPYAREDPTFFDTPMDMGSFFSQVPFDAYAKDYFARGRAFMAAREQLMAQSDVKRARDENEAAICKITENRSESSIDDLKALRARRKELAALYDEELVKVGGRICGEYFGAPFFEQMRVLLYKDRVLLSTLSNLRAVEPALARLRLPSLEGKPVFTHHFKQLTQALEAGRQIAVTGGPCLFGRDEVTIRVCLRSGAVYSMDYSMGKDKDLPEDVETLLTHQASDVADISFINMKPALTAEEFNSLYILFLTADALGAPLAFPIPDMSYMKYMREVTSALAPSVRDAACRRYEQVLFDICDLYLNRIQGLKREFPKVETRVMHMRDEALCKLFEHERDKYFTRRHFYKSLTGNPLRVSSIYDYVAMPALPFYVFGIRDVLHINSTDEIDPHIKCVKEHKQAVNFSALFYPERISADGLNTIFYATREDKEYGREER